MHNLVSCVFLFKGSYVIHVVDSLTLDSRPTALISLPRQAYLSVTRFPHKSITAAVLMSTGLHTLGAILNSEITNKKQKRKKPGTRQTIERTFVYSTEAGLEGSVALACLSWARAHGVTRILKRPWPHCQCQL